MDVYCCRVRSTQQKSANKIQYRNLLIEIEATRARNDAMAAHGQQQPTPLQITPNYNGIHTDALALPQAAFYGGPESAAHTLLSW